MCSSYFLWQKSLELFSDIFFSRTCICMMIHVFTIIWYINTRSCDSKGRTDNIFLEMQKRVYLFKFNQKGGKGRKRNFPKGSTNNGTKIITCAPLIGLQHDAPSNWQMALTIIFFVEWCLWLPSVNYVIYQNDFRIIQYKIIVRFQFPEEVFTCIFTLLIIIYR